MHDVSQGVGDLRAELTQVDERKRTVYSVAAIAAAAVVALSWAVREPDDAFIATVYPVFGVFLIAFAGVIHVRRLSIRVLEGIALVPITLVIMVRLAWLLRAPEPLEERLLLLVGAHYWAVGALIVAGFVLLDRRYGIAYGSALITLSALMVTFWTGNELRDLGGSPNLFVYVVRVHAFLVLLLVLAAGVGTLRSHLQRALARAEVFAELARTDPLTGVANRRATAEELERQISAARRYGHDLSVVAVDVDHFKVINDTYGHQRGDEVLADVARVLASQLRESDRLGRWGGEEFLIVAPHTDAEQAAALAERCRSALVAQPAEDLEVTATFGVATYRPDEHVDELLMRADELLYTAKGAGRDRVLDDRTA